MLGPTREACSDPLHVERSESLIEIGDRLLEHRAMGRDAGLLQIGECASASKHQRRALSLPRGLFSCDSGPCHTRPFGGVLL